MTNQTTPSPEDGPDAAAQCARERINQLSDLFSEMNMLMHRWLDEVGPADLAQGKKMLGKLSDMQTTHLMVLRAEEAFYEKFSDTTASDTVDYERIRAELGRALDRIRDAERPDRLSEPTDGSASGGDPLSV